MYSSGMSPCAGFIFIVCVIASMLFARTGCINGYCLNYIHTNGLVLGHRSSTYMYKDETRYKIYTDVIWSDGKICSEEMPGIHYRNTTTKMMDINDKVEIYVIKSNPKYCSINNKTEMESNAIGSIIFVIFAGIMLVLLIWSCLPRCDAKINHEELVLSEV